MKDRTEYEAQLARVARTADCPLEGHSTKVTGNGWSCLDRKYTVHGELAGPRGAAWVSTIWIKERGKAHVGLVTVRPRWP